MKILVTGGAGFIGSHIVDRFVQEGFEVVVADNLSTGSRGNVNPAARFYRADIRGRWLERVFRRERPAIVCHHAAQMDVRRSVEDPVQDAEINIIGTLNVLRNALKYGARKVIFASSGGAVYGEPMGGVPASESHPVRPSSPYGISKAVGDEYLRYFFEAGGLEYVSLRYANVYGPRQNPLGEAGVVGIFARKMLMGEQPIINGNGRQTRDFIYVDDVVEANVAALNKAAHGVYNVGTGKETTINELFGLLAGLITASCREVHGPAKKGEQLSSSLDSTRIHRALDWEPKVPLKEGLARTVEFYRRTES